MGEANSRKIKEIQSAKFYGNWFLNVFMKGKAVMEISPEGIFRNYPRKSIFIPWIEVITIFDDWYSIPNSMSSRDIIGITVTTQYAKNNYKKFYTIKQIIRKSTPFKFSDGLSGTSGNSKKSHNFDDERVVIFLNPNLLRHKGKGLFKNLEFNLEISKLGYTYKNRYNKNWIDFWKL